MDDLTKIREWGPSLSSIPKKCDFRVFAIHGVELIFIPLEIITSGRP